MGKNNQPKWAVRSSVAFILWFLGITGGFIFTGFKPAAHYVTYALFLTVGLGVYIGKRIIKHRIDVNNLLKK